MTLESVRISLREKIGYGMGDAAFNFIWMTFIYFGTYFYTDVFGISAAAVGTLFLIARFWDTANDPLMGIIVDRTKSRWGKFRPYLLFGSLPMGIIAVLCFTTPDLSIEGKAVYASITYLLIGMIYTALNVPYASLLGVITADSNERNGLSSARMVGAYCGGLVVNFATLKLVKWFGQGDDQAGFQLTMGLYAVIMVILLLLTFSWTRERVTPAVPNKRAPFWEDLLNLVTNIPFIVLFFVGIFTLSWVSIRGASVLYYFKYYLLKEDVANWYLTGFTLCNIVGAALTQWICKGRDKTRVFIVLMLLNAVTVGVVYFVGPEDMLVFSVLYFVNGIIGGPITVIVFSMYADIVDYTEYKKGHRIDGLIFSGASFSQKLGWTVGGSAAAFLLAYFHYQPNVAQSEEALTGIRLMFTWIPGALSIVAALAMATYRLTDDTMIEIREALKKTA